MFIIFNGWLHVCTILYTIIFARFCNSSNQWNQFVHRALHGGPCWESFHSKFLSTQFGSIWAVPWTVCHSFVLFPTACVNSSTNGTAVLRRLLCDLDSKMVVDIILQNHRRCVCCTNLIGTSNLTNSLYQWRIYILGTVMFDLFEGHQTFCNN